jgi:diaminopimelate epimerase
VAALRHAGRETGEVAVRAPGGRLRVTVGDGTTVLHGPAVLVAHGELAPGWWESVG